MKTVEVRKYKSDQKLAITLLDDECPACEAIHVGGCGEGLIFLECEGILYRCYVVRLLGMLAISCTQTTGEKADEELAREGVKLD
jgi:hypothetical protein